MTLVLKVDPERPDPEPIARAAAVIRAGGLVAFPTETVYGLGANALDPEAVAGIFRAKDRPAYDPLIVHLLDATVLPDVVSQVPDVALELIARFWPGPLTLVLPRGPQVPTQVTAGGDTVAVRVPSHPVARALLAAAQVPIAAPSANRFGRVSPTCAEHVLADLDGRIDLLLDGGSTQVGVESTVLSLAGSIATILRPGGVSLEALAEALGEVQVAQEIPVEGEVLLSPGTTSKHYAPHAIVVLYRGGREAVLERMRQDAVQRVDHGDTVGLLLVDEDLSAFGALPVRRASLGTVSTMEEVAQQLYAALRTLDQADVSVIMVRDFGPEGLGLAIRDRLTRAAAGRVIVVTEDAA
ncbi:MAG: L-threonylcarbamoyladenylate synthase [Anaerolineae bacterium]|nr:L-threonylcarbamoyladenylate synthase [Anaerolineae bacterium]